MKAFYMRPKGSTSRLFQDLADYSAMADKWGSTMGLFFDVAGEMAQRGLTAPAAWGYSPGWGGPEVSEFNIEPLGALDEPTLARLGTFCHLLCASLERAGLSY